MVLSEAKELPTQMQKWGNKHSVQVVYILCIASELHHSAHP